MLLVAVLLVAAFVLFMLVVPAALAAAEIGQIRTELSKAIVRTICQGIAYPVMFLWLGLKGWNEDARH